MDDSQKRASMATSVNYCRRRRCCCCCKHKSLLCALVASPVCPDLVKFRHFGWNFWKSLVIFRKLYLVFGNILNLLQQKIAIRQNVIVVIGQILNNNLAIWSHWTCDQSCENFLANCIVEQFYARKKNSQQELLWTQKTFSAKGKNIIIQSFANLPFTR